MAGPLNWFSQILSVTLFSLRTIPQRLGSSAAAVIGIAGVVAVQYPRAGIWSIGLRTGRPMPTVQRAVGDRLVTVFIPSSPTPVTGYVIQVPVSDVIDLNMTIDEALRFTISGGVIQPGARLEAPGAVDDE